MKLFNKMYTRHNEIQPLQTTVGKVSAVYYNHVQTGLKRINKSLRYSIPTLKHLDLILHDDAWIVVDTVLNDMPILAWTDFNVDHRENLHEPIKCNIKFFHYAADMIMNKTLEAMELLLGEELDTEISGDSSDIIPFKNDS
ncbi:MAG TPA: hypothetical protein ENJ28_02695 [Gammaproteobacteria bacterium]|nr:hypothetical protein [Gammaproteobacteria bacterium]